MAEHHASDDTPVLDGNQGNDDVTLISQPFDQTSLGAVAEYISHESTDRIGIGLILRS